MVEAAERDEVRGFRLAAVRPVLHVMRIGVTSVGATGEAAAAIAGIECASQGRRNAARLAADVERLTLVVLQNHHGTAVASEAACSFRGNARAILDFALAGRAVAQCL